MGVNPFRSFPIQSWLRTGLDFVYPRVCCACGEAVHEPLSDGLCWDCRTDTLPLGPPWCETCGAVTAGRIDHAFICSDCVGHPPAYDQARSLFRYEGGVREAIHAMKYRRDFSVIPDLARLLNAGVQVHFPDFREAVLVPVPLHTHKMRMRGFNQSLELIRAMRRENPALRMWNGVRRVRNTETQTRLSKAGRRENVRGAFRVPRKRIPGVPETVVLVDDVMTTGSTVDACARALKRAGAARVFVLTLARG